MHDNAPSRVSKLTREFFEHKGEKIIEWPPSNPNLNPFENLWLVVKMKLYEGSKQCNSKADQWESIKTIMSGIEPVEVKKLKSFDNRLPLVIEKNHLYIRM